EVLLGVLSPQAAGAALPGYGAEESSSDPTLPLPPLEPLATETAQLSGSETLFDLRPPGGSGVFSGDTAVLSGALTESEQPVYQPPALAPPPTEQMPGYDPQYAAPGYPQQPAPGAEGGYPGYPAGYPGYGAPASPAYPGYPAAPYGQQPYGQPGYGAQYGQPQ